MIKEDKNALICDLAETYHIYDYQSLPVKTVAILACGLRDDSRIKLKLSGQKYSTDTLLSAAIADNTRVLAWMQSEDGRKNRRRPDLILPKLLETEKKQETVNFCSGKDFEKAWNQITGKEG